MYRVIENKKISNDSYFMRVEAPNIINNFIPGQFVIVMAYCDSERIPLTIYDCSDNYVDLIYQVVGASTLELSKVSDEIFSITGPLGRPSELCRDYKKYKDRKIVYVAGGVGIAPVYPQVKYLKEKGIDIDIIYGARCKDLLLIRDKIEKIANVSYVTDDGSYGDKGLVTDILEKNINKYDYCVAIGPVMMMKYVCLLTKKYNVDTIVSMNPIMIDGSGMCGACRCKVDGKVKFACIDGPEFDGHKVDFDTAIKRMKIYKKEEEELYNKMRGKYE